MNMHLIYYVMTFFFLHFTEWFVNRTCNRLLACWPDVQEQLCFWKKNLKTCIFAYHVNLGGDHMSTRLVSGVRGTVVNHKDSSSNTNRDKILYPVCAKSNISFRHFHALATETSSLISPRRHNVLLSVSLSPSAAFVFRIWKWRTLSVLDCWFLNAAFGMMLIPDYDVIMSPMLNFFSVTGSSNVTPQELISVYTTLHCV